MNNLYQIPPEAILTFLAALFILCVLSVVVMCKAAILIYEWSVKRKKDEKRREEISSTIDKLREELMSINKEMTTKIRGGGKWKD